MRRDHLYTEQSRAQPRLPQHLQQLLPQYRKDPLPHRYATLCPIFRVATRQQSGLVEDLLRTQVADKTNWRALLKGDAVPLDLPAIRDQLLESCAEGIAGLQQRFGLQAIQPVGDAEVLEIRYPVEAYPTKVASTSRNRCARTSSTSRRTMAARYSPSAP